MELFNKATKHDANPNELLKLIRKWCLNEEDYPLLVEESVNQALQYLIRSGQAEHVAEVIGDEFPAMRARLIRGLIRQQQYVVSYSFIQRYGLTNNPTWSKAVQQCMINYHADDLKRQQQRMRIRNESFNMSPHVRVLMLDNLEAMYEARVRINSMIENAAIDVIGIDSEYDFQPRYGVAQKAVLLQIALREFVLLFDLLYWTDEQDQLLSDILLNCRLKLGYGLANDVYMCRAVHPNSKSFANDAVFRPQLDFAENAVRYSIPIPKTDQSSLNRRQRLGGLSLLTKDVLGAPLDKTFQMSNWKRRPLTNDQIEYAALDAHVLISIYDHLRNSFPHVDLSKPVNTKSAVQSSLCVPKS